MSVIGEGQVTGGNDRHPSGREGWTSSGWKVFGPVISFGSGQLIFNSAYSKIFLSEKIIMGTTGGG